MPLSHGEEGPGTCVIEYEPHVLGLAAIIISVTYGGRDTETSIQLILYKGWTGMSVSRGVIDDVLVHATYHDWG